jgi:hypothetical protein
MKLALALMIGLSRLAMARAIDLALAREALTLRHEHVEQLVLNPFARPSEDRNGGAGLW